MRPDFDALQAEVERTQMALQRAEAAEVVARIDAYNALSAFTEAAAQILERSA